jgi:hypothetical protein
MTRAYIPQREPTTPVKEEFPRAMKIPISVVTGILAGALSLGAWAVELPEATILSLERRAMDGWLHGSPEPLLEISAPDITFFHSTLPSLVVGRAAVAAVYESYRGRPLFDRYEILDPRVAISGATGVLTYELVTQNGPLTRRWHATQVYRRGSADWRIAHSHFSQVQP